MADAFERIAAALEKIADKPTPGQEATQKAALRGRLGW